MGFSLQRRDIIPLCALLPPAWGVLTSYLFLCITARHSTENSKQIFPEKELRGSVPLPVSTFMCLWAIYVPAIGLPILLLENMGTEPGLNKSCTGTGMWKLGLRPHNSFSGNTQMEFSLQRGGIITLCKLLPPAWGVLPSELSLPSPPNKYHSVVKMGIIRESWEASPLPPDLLKRLSHEIDFKNFDQTLKNLT